MDLDNMASQKDIENCRIREDLKKMYEVLECKRKNNLAWYTTTLQNLVKKVETGSLGKTEGIDFTNVAGIARRDLTTESLEFTEAAIGYFLRWAWRETQEPGEAKDLLWKLRAYRGSLQTLRAEISYREYADIVLAMFPTNINYIWK
jgi:hypothetical protein